MKCLVLSDSHGRLEEAADAVRREQPALIFHLGDHIGDAAALGRLFPQIPVKAVPGNCDRPGNAPETAAVVLAGVKIFYTHGHRYGVKSSYLRAELAAREAAADVLLFGHTHEAFCQTAGGLLILNPGTCGSYGRATYGVLELEDGRAMGRLEKCR